MRFAQSTDTALAEHETFRIAGREQPFAQPRIVDIAVGSSLEDALREIHAETVSYARLYVAVDGKLIRSDLWAETRPQAGSHVTAAYVPTAPLIVLALGGIGITGTAATLIAYAIIIVGTLLLGLAVQALLGLPEQADSDYESRSHTIRGTKNRAWIGNAIFQVYGRHRMFMPFASLPFTEVIGNKQFLRLLFDCGPGPLVMTNLKIGATDINDFSLQQVTKDVGPEQVDTKSSRDFGAGAQSAFVGIGVNWVTEGLIVGEFIHSSGFSRVNSRGNGRFRVTAIGTETTTDDGFTVELADNTDPAFLTDTGSGTQHITLVEQSADFVFHDGTVQSPTFEIFPSDVKQDDLSFDFKLKWFQSEAPAHIHTFADPADEIQFDFNFVSGLTTFADSGKTKDWTVSFKVEAKRDDGDDTYREVASYVEGVSADPSDLRAQLSHDAPGPNVVKIGGHLIFTAKSRAPILQGFRIRTQFLEGRGIYTLRITRIAGDAGGASANLQNAYPVSAGGTNEKKTVLSDCTWFAARAILYESPVNTELLGEFHAFLEMRIQATEQFNGIIDTVNAIFERKVRTFDGATWGPKVLSRNPAWIAADILSQFPISDSRIDAPAFKAWADKNEPTPGSYDFAYNRVMDFDTNFAQILKDISATARASIVRSDGLYSVLIDEDRTPVGPTQQITPRNVRDFTFQKQWIDFPDAIRLKFMDENTWQRTDRIVYNDGFGVRDADTGSISMSAENSTQSYVRPTGDFIADGFVAGGFLVASGFADSANNGQKLIFSVAATRIVVDSAVFLEDDVEAGGRQLLTNGAVKFETAELPGVTIPNQVWKEGRFRIATGKLRPHVYTTTMDWEHLVAQRGDMVRVSHYVVQVGLGSARIKDLFNTAGPIWRIDFDAGIYVPADVPFGVVVRKADGTEFTAAFTITPPFPEWKDFGVFTTQGAADPSIGDLLTLGELGTETFDAVIFDIDRRPQLGAKLSLFDHSPAIYSSDLDTIPAFTSNVSELFTPDLNPPATPRILGTDFRFSHFDDAGVTFLFIDAIITSDIAERTATVGEVWAETAFFEVQYQIAGLSTADPLDQEDGAPEPGPVLGDWTMIPRLPSNQTAFSLGPFPISDSINIRVRGLSRFGVVSPWTQSNDVQAEGSVVAVTDLKIDTILESTGRGIVVSMVITWNHPPDSDDLFSTFAVGVQRNVEPRVSARTPDRFLKIEDAPDGFYTIDVQAISPSGQRSNVVTIQEQYIAHAVQSIPRPPGLELAGQGNSQEWTGRDVFFQWQPIRFPVIPMAIPDPIGDPDVDDNFIVDYTVRIFDNKPSPDGLFSAGRLLRVIDHVTETFSKYTYEDNVEDHTDVSRALFSELLTYPATRKLNIRVSGRDKFGNIGPEAIINVSNPPPPIPQTHTVFARASTAIINLSYGLFGAPPLPGGKRFSSDADYRGVVAFSSTTPGFTPSQDNLVYDGQPRTAIQITMQSGARHFFVLAAYDEFGLLTDGSPNIAELEFGPEFFIDIAAPAGVDGVVTEDDFDIVFFDGSGNDDGIWIPAHTAFIEIEGDGTADPTLVVVEFSFIAYITRILTIPALRIVPGDPSIIPVFGIIPLDAINEIEPQPDHLEVETFARAHMGGVGTNPVFLYRLMRERRDWESHLINLTGNDPDPGEALEYAIAIYDEASDADLITCIEDGLFGAIYSEFRLGVGGDWVAKGFIAGMFVDSENWTTGANNGRFYVVGIGTQVAPTASVRDLYVQSEDRLDDEPLVDETQSGDEIVTEFATGIVKTWDGVTDDLEWYRTAGTPPDASPVQPSEVIRGLAVGSFDGILDSFVSLEDTPAQLYPPAGTEAKQTISAPGYVMGDHGSVIRNVVAQATHAFILQVRWEKWAEAGVGTVIPEFNLGYDAYTISGDDDTDFMAQCHGSMLITVTNGLGTTEYMIRDVLSNDLMIVDTDDGSPNTGQVGSYTLASAPPETVGAQASLITLHVVEKG